jgi:hypothetical protein
MTSSWIAWGAGTKLAYDIKDPVSTCDTAATALWLLDVPLPIGWDGKPVTSAFIDSATKRLPSTETRRDGQCRGVFLLVPYFTAYRLELTSNFFLQSSLQNLYVLPLCCVSRRDGKNSSIFSSLSTTHTRQNFASSCSGVNLTGCTGADWLERDSVGVEDCSVCEVQPTAPNTTATIEKSQRFILLLESTLVEPCGFIRSPKPPFHLSILDPLGMAIRICHVHALW